MANKVTMKQEIFCQEWVDTIGNGTFAALKAFDIEGKEILEIPDKDRTEEQKIIADKAYKIASSMATEYLRKPSILKRIDEILEERGFNDDSVKKEHFKLISQDEDKGVKARSIDMFYKLKGKYTENIDITSKGNPITGINYIIPKEDGDNNNTDI